MLEPEEFSQEPSIRGTDFDSKVSLEIIYFSFDSSALPQSVVKISKENAKYLKENPSVNVVVEGHCDERGTT